MAGDTINSVRGKGVPKRKKPVDHISGVMLAGGLSQRFGQNKAFIEIDGARLIDHIAEQMKTIFSRVILITNQKRAYEYLNIPIIEDLIKGLGPLGGIYTGLMSISDQAGFFVACDMPFINEQLIRYMVDIKDTHDAVVPLVANEIEPLYAIYTKSCSGPIKKLIDSQCYQIRLFYNRISVRYVREEEIRKFCSPSKTFFNINTPEEFNEIRSLVKS